MTNARDWSEAVGDVWASEWRRTDRSFAGLASALDAAIRAAAPAGPGQVLDIGCGAGATSLAIAAARGDLAVLGIDVSSELIEVARDRAARAELANTRFATADLNAALPDLPAADLLVSRHGVMFADDPVAMFARLHAAARPGATLLFSCFRSGAENPWSGALASTVAGAAPPPPAGYAPGPFAFGDPAFVSDVLNRAGWRDPAHRPVDYEYIAGAGVDPVADAAGFFSRIGPVAAMMRESSRPPEQLRASLVAELQKHRHDDRVVFPAAAWLWSTRA